MTRLGVDSGPAVSGARPARLSEVLPVEAWSDRYRPSPAQYRFGTTRDRTCRQPAGGRPVARVDLDHVIAHADGGPTDCD